MRTMRDVAALLASRLLAPNPVQAGTIAADLGLSNGTPTVSVTLGDATRRALYLPPAAIVVGGHVFVAPLDGRADAPLAVIATNYQVAGATPSGYGNGGYGSIPYGE